ncbi:hypothetical protein VmeM32_00163 [Vibrio phage vB_VmeM-32]|nr:hypothetical protein VmeM32_00163 [Vibrio phage vB_VmeM-32]
MFSYKKYILYFVLSMTLLSSGYFLHNRYVELIESNTSLQSQVNSQNASLLELKRSIELAESHRIKYENKTNLLQRQLRVTHSNLDQMKDRNDVVLNRMSLIEKMVNDSINEFTKQLSCETGATELCLE